MKGHLKVRSTSRKKTRTTSRFGRASAREVFHVFVMISLRWGGMGKRRGGCRI
jgi:hypothetical protein